MGLADCLSRVPLNEEEKQTMDYELMVLVAETFACTNHQDVQWRFVQRAAWPGMKKQIEDVVSECSVCLTYKNKPAKEHMSMKLVPE
ncbi:hypothetical protein DPMN_035844 [Dreissena polymorpha]|uniref:Integrase zinc-binding domain-containing protein n=1 Tax=Dreissena polymorpha TaxID=45954 RepID=A0A9D4RNB9_DREPO|nr:hypothetical protein DPMN_035844 [Dreissena polymorpha]